MPSPVSDTSGTEVGGVGGAVLTGDTWGAWTHTSGQIISEWSSFGVGRGPALGMPSVFVIHTLNCRRHVVWLQREPQWAWAGLWARLSAVSFRLCGGMPACAPHRGLGEGPGSGRRSAVLHTETARKGAVDPRI